MNIRIGVLIAALVTAVLTVRAQSGSPLDFFPHHKGDMWEYRDPFNTAFRDTNTVISDSVGPDGKCYLACTMFDFDSLMIDTTNYQVWGNRWGGPLYSSLLYKLDAQIGDSWFLWRSQLMTFKATVVDVFQTSIFGRIVTVKEIAETDSASNLLLSIEYLASGLGLIRWDGDLGPALILDGAIIDGVKYGRLLGVKADLPSRLPESVQLDQNYPNPFNGFTKIRFVVPVATHVQLSVFDVLGKGVATLQNGYLAPGAHSVSWDAAGLPTGLYFYRLITGSSSTARRMILVR